MRRLLTALAITTVMAASSAPAAVITLEADGTGDYPTLQDAVAAANPNDEIVLLAGTYVVPAVGYVYITTPDLTIRGQSGSGATFLDGASSTVIAIRVGTSPLGGFTLEGLTIQNSNGVEVFDSQHTRLEDVVVTGAGGDGIEVYGTQDATLQGVRVENAGNRGISIAVSGDVHVSNSEALGCGERGISLSGTLGGTATVVDCYAHGNGPVSFGGGLFVSAFGNVDIGSSTFCHNNASFGGGIHLNFGSSGVVRECTIAYNEGSQGAMFNQSGGLIDRTIIVSNDVGLGGASGSVSDCDIWGNGTGDGLGVMTDLGGNISADPMFCGAPGSENYYLSSASPCAAANSPGGVLIGAWPTACGAVPTEETSWGELKSDYR